MTKNIMRQPSLKPFKIQIIKQIVYFSKSLISRASCDAHDHLSTINVLNKWYTWEQDVFFVSSLCNCPCPHFPRGNMILSQFWCQYPLFKVDKGLPFSRHLYTFPPATFTSVCDFWIQSPFWWFLPHADY